MARWLDFSPMGRPHSRPVAEVPALLPPEPTAVVGVPNGAAISDGPTVVRVDENYVQKVNVLESAGGDLLGPPCRIAYKGDAQSDGSKECRNRCAPSQLESSYRLSHRRNLSTLRAIDA